MGKYRISLAISIALLMCFTVDSKAVTINGRVSATVVKSSFDIKCTQLSFGNIKKVWQAGQISISPVGERRITGHIEMGATTHHASICKITGPANTSYTAKAPEKLTFTTDSVFIDAESASTLTVSDIQITSKNTENTTGYIHEGKSDSSGKDELSVGATLQVPENAAPGVYQGIIPITINY